MLVGEEGFSDESVPLSPASSFYRVTNSDELAPKTRRRIFDLQRSEEVTWLLLPPDPLLLEDFRASLVTRHPLTQRAYLGTLRDFLAWLAQQPAGNPFHIESLTQTAVQGYLDVLKSRGAAPRTRSRAIVALRRFGQWAVDEEYLRRNPARQLERPTVVALAPTELSGKQRFVLKSLVERLASPRLTAIFTLGYWAGLRVSEVAALRVDQCHVN